MNFILELYRSLKVRTRIIILCASYSLCIIGTAVLARSSSLTMAICSTALFTFLGIVFSGLLISSINDGLSRISGYLARMTKGDLTKPINPQNNTELSNISRSIGVLQTTFLEIISQISKTSDHLANASHKLQSSAEQIATGAEQVASQTGTVATASEEMSATSSDIAHNCLMAAENSNKASETAHSGADIVQTTISGMGKIAEKVRDAAKTVESLGARSDQIGQIIGTIEDIADQTLSLIHISEPTRPY